MPLKPSGPPALSLPPPACLAVVCSAPTTCAGPRFSSGVVCVIHPHPHPRSGSHRTANSWRPAPRALTAPRARVLPSPLLSSPAAALVADALLQPFVFAGCEQGVAVASDGPNINPDAEIGAADFRAANDSSSPELSLRCVLVRADVPREAAGVSKGLAACVARVGLVAGVHPKVHRELAGRRKGLAACVARVGLVARVHPKVRSEGTGLSEGLAACVTGEELVAGVHPGATSGLRGCTDQDCGARHWRGRPPARARGGKRFVY